MDLRLQQLKRYLRDLRGDDQVDLFRFSVRSLSDRIDYAQYHIDEATRLITPFREAGGPRPEDDHTPFNTAMMHAAAHFLACLQSLHACADICAHVVYYGLGFNLDPKAIKERDIGASSVLRKIPDSAVSLALRRLVEDPEFEYLDAVVNHSKHRAVIRTPYTFEPQNAFDESSWHGIKLWRFERLGRSYPSQRAEEFLKTELDRQRSAHTAVTLAVEEHLYSEWSEQKRLHESRGERWPPKRVSNDSDGE